MQEVKGAGWLIFACFMLFISGIFNIIWGITALVKEEYLESRLLFANFNAWGVFWIIIGVIALFAAFAVLTKAQWARWFGIILASISAIGMFAVLQVYPVWSMMVIALDVLVIYGLAEYAGPTSPA